MKSFKISLLIISAQLFSAGFIFAGTVPPDSTIFPGQTGATLRNSLISSYKSTSNLGYDVGRDVMYGEIDKLNDSLECVYSGYKIYMDPNQDPSTWAYDHDINCEHTWPQSRLSSSTAVSDLHHLFPTEVQVNGDRGNYPFGDIVDNQANYWYRNNVRTSTVPSSNIDEYAECLSGVKFEPREKQKGNTARAMYYILTFWQLGDTNDSWWTGQRDVLYAWHVNDPADAREIARTKKIATYQQNKVNPYVLDSTLIRRAYFPSLGVTGKPQINIADRNKLYQNNPNPFRDKTVISYSLASPGQARIEIYNLLGQAVRMIEVNKPASGRYELEWNGADQAGRMLPPGVYFYRLSVNDKTIDLKRMIMLK
ncbi:MAG: endonuclease [Candidatus Edwardsbacteria bacterium]|nr:endonuclease [Candidatus Edwardsbacteria bacterium]MBU1577679.1 endonuclease [Candidatus Edwardsbacteria bacterium]MBU2463349.1 endonuclease [Candidatus Edwardsbacteria bacterium]MBU2594576.1 endonuclease [Candidatus Edwardsbacteria bacterium]